MSTPNSLFCRTAAACALAGLSALLPTQADAEPSVADLAALRAAAARTPRSQQLFSMAALQAEEARRESERAPRYNLEQLILQSIQQHPTIGARRAELNAANSDVEASRWQFFPTPSVSTQRLDQRSTTTIALQQPLWTGGRLSYGLAASESRAQSAEIAISDQQYQLAMRLVSSWQTWYQATGRAEAIARSITLLQGYIEMVRRRIAGGASADVDLQLVQSRLAQAEADLAVTRASQRASLASLGQLVGQTLTAERLARPNPQERYVAPPLPDLLAQALAGHTSLRRLESDLEAAQNDIGVRRASLYPTLSLRAEHQRGRLYPTSLLDEDRLLLVLDYQPGAGLSAQSLIEAAEGRVAALRQNLEATRRDLTERITSDYEEHLASLSRLEQTQRTVRANADVLDSYDRLFVAGKRSWLDVLNAARELTQAETTLADLAAQTFTSAYRLRLHTRQLDWQAN